MKNKRLEDASDKAWREYRRAEWERQKQYAEATFYGRVAKVILLCIAGYAMGHLLGYVIVEMSELLYGGLS